VLQELMSDERWASLETQFHDTFCQVYGLPARSLLATAMQLGMSLL